MTDWWRGAAVYQIYPRSFADSNDDGVGDLPGITSRLEHVAGLGVDAIWLSPFFTSPMRDFGYDVADYCDVAPIFGTLDDFDALLARARSLGLKVIIDQVYSHTSSLHPWFLESRRSRDNPRADWYVWADARPDGTPPNNWLSVFGGPAWSWDTQRRQYYLHNFLAEQPDLNFHNRDVQNAILDVARFWLERGVDGFRLDVANYYFHDHALRDNPPTGTIGNLRPYQFQTHRFNRSRPETLSFLNRLRALLDTYRDRMSVAEIASSAHIGRSMEYTEGNDRLHTAYNFLFLESNDLTPGLVRDAIKDWTSSTAWPSWSFSNHDVMRALSRWGHGDDSPALAKQLIALLGCLRGSVFLYQGEELGLPQADVPFERLRDPEAIRFWPENLGRDGGRTPMPWKGREPHAGFSTTPPWLPVDARHEQMAVDRQAMDPDSTLNFTRAFFAMRRERPELIRGDMVFLDAADPVLLFERRLAGRRLLCAFNLSDRATTLEAPLPDDSEIVLAQGLDKPTGRAEVCLSPRGVLLAKLGTLTVSQ